MKKSFNLRSLLDIPECINAIHNLPVSDKNSFHVSIVSGSDLRSLKQNKLYWKHIDEISRQSHDSRHNIHYGLKRKHLHPIFMAGDTAKNLVYQANFQSMCVVKEAGVNIDFEILHNKMLSTTDCTVGQMFEYMESYWIEINQRGIQLTDPDSFMEYQDEI